MPATGCLVITEQLTPRSEKIIVAFVTTFTLVACCARAQTIFGAIAAAIARPCSRAHSFALLTVKAMCALIRIPACFRRQTFRCSLIAGIHTSLAQLTSLRAVQRLICSRCAQLTEGILKTSSIFTSAFEESAAKMRELDRHNAELQRQARAVACTVVSRAHGQWVR